MGLKIKANSFTANRELEVFSDGVRFVEAPTAGMATKRSFRYPQIDHVFLGDDNVLAFQVGNEVFSVPIQRDRPDHLQALNAFLQGVGQSRAMAH